MRAQSSVSPGNSKNLNIAFLGNYIKAEKIESLFPVAEHAIRTADLPIAEFSLQFCYEAEILISKTFMLEQ